MGSPRREAYGLDLTGEMRDLAGKNAGEAGVENVEFLEGEIEDVPLLAEHVDVGRQQLRHQPLYSERKVHGRGVPGAEARRMVRSLRGGLFREQGCSGTVGTNSRRTARDTPSPTRHTPTL